MNYQGPGKYRHYKGGEYEVVGLSLGEATLERCVLYRPLPGNPSLLDKPYPLEECECQFWARPLDDFNSQILDLTFAPDRSVPRFQKVD